MLYLIITGKEYNNKNISTKNWGPTVMPVLVNKKLTLKLLLD